MTDLIPKDSIVNCESFQSIENVLQLIHMNKNLIATNDNFLVSEATFYNHLKNLVERSTDLNVEECQNYLNLFLTNQLYAMTIQIHSLADLTAQLICELQLVTLYENNGNVSTIDKVSFKKVKQKLVNQSASVYTQLLNALSCFDNADFEYFEILSNTIKHKFIPVTSEILNAVSGGSVVSEFQVNEFTTFVSGIEINKAAELLPNIIAKYESFKNEFDQVIVELNNLAP